MSRALFDLGGKLALVTGSSQGIGFALAKGLAEAGAKVVLNGRDAGKLDAARARLAEAGIAVETAPFDVTDPALVEAGIAAIEAAHGPLSSMRVPQVKLLQPLLPGERARVELDGAGGRWKFRVLRGGTLLASGEVAGGAE